MGPDTTALILLVLLVTLLYVGVGLKTVKEHQQGVVTRFGRFHHMVPPGLALVVPFVDELRTVDLRTLAVEQRIDPAAGTGRVRLWDESWPAQSRSGEAIGAGASIRIVRLDGEYVVVEPRS